MSKGRSIVGRCGKYLTDIKSCIAGNDRISFSFKWYENLIITDI